MSELTHHPFDTREQPQAPIPRCDFCDGAHRLVLHLQDEIARLRGGLGDGPETALQKQWMERWAAEPEYTCTVCGLPSKGASMGGPGICAACDCGNFRDGTRWSYGEAMLVVRDSSEKQKAEFRRIAAERSPVGERAPTPGETP